MSHDLYTYDGTFIGQFSSVTDAKTDVAMRVGPEKWIQWRDGTARTIWAYVDGEPRFTIKGRC